MPLAWLVRFGIILLCGAAAVVPACVADAPAANRWVAITADGHSNKEPDWIPAGK